jgi:hypothetical protein
MNTWVEANQQALSREVARVRATLEAWLARRTNEATPAGLPSEPAPEPAGPDTDPSPTALDTVCAAFGLSPFERDLLLLCAAPDLDSKFISLFAQANGDARRTAPTFSLALAALPDAHWSALLPTAPLRRWRLIEVGSGDALTQGALRMDEWLLHFLAGVPYLDERLQALVRPAPPAPHLSDSQQGAVDRLLDLGQSHRPGARWPLIHLFGDSADDQLSVAAAVCAQLGCRLFQLSPSDAPGFMADREAFARLWEREAALCGSALVVDLQETDSPEHTRHALALTESITSLVVLLSREPLRELRRAAWTLEVTRPSTREQHGLWRAALGPLAAALNGEVEAVASQFRLTAREIREAAQALSATYSANQPFPVGRGSCRAGSPGLAGWLGRSLAPPRPEPSGGTAPAPALNPPIAPGEPSVAPAQSSPSSPPGAQPTHPASPNPLWSLCRARCRVRLESLAQRIEPAATWDDLVLPEFQIRTLHEMAAQVRNRYKVYEEWGWASKGTRGLGISALFAGPSGTGKTMAAEVLASDLQLDLFRIDLSAVVSKYIGETEKNLRRVFDAAESGGAVLLFDEADALFGKRSEVKDSHDRYANIEVGYLLQRIEAYRGLAILTTNSKQALDAAFLRRLRFIVQFPFPDAAQRAEIWQKVFPAATPTQGLDPAKLARLNVSGATIRSIALHAAFEAADAQGTVSIAKVLQATHLECGKLERQPSRTETEDWVDE